MPLRSTLGVRRHCQLKYFLFTCNYLIDLPSYIFVATPKQHQQLDGTINVKSHTQKISYFDFSSLVSLDNYKFASNDNIFNMTQDLNRIKVVLVEQKKTGKWLAEQLGVSACTVSRWASNTAQPNLSTLNDIAKLLGVDVKELINSEK